MLRLVSLPIWHGLSHGRLQLELAAQPALAKRWKALLKKEAKAAGRSKKKDKGAAVAAADGDAAAAGDGDQAAATAAAGTVPELPRAEASFLPGMLQEFLQVLRTADSRLTGQPLEQQQQQQQPEEQPATAAAAEDDEEQEDGLAGDDDDVEMLQALVEEADGPDAAAAGGDATGAAVNGHQQGPKKGAGKRQRRRPRADPPGVPRLLLLHLERFVEFLIDLLSQLPTRRFVHALVEDQQLLVKVSLLGMLQGCQCT